MNDDLLTAARALAERGWLPGIAIDSADMLCRIGYSDIRCRLNEETMEAHLHLAAHREIVRRKWFIAVDALLQNTTSIDTEMFVTGPTVTEPGTTTLSLLRALLAACEAAESKEKNDG